MSVNNGLVVASNISNFTLALGITMLKRRLDGFWFINYDHIETKAEAGDLKLLMLIFLVICTIPTDNSQLLAKSKGTE